MKLLEDPKLYNAVKIATLLILLTSCALYYLSVPLWDLDFWWHIATGQYIVSTGSLPDQDPFSFTSALEENKNPFPKWENFILKQYWLSQIIFYFIYDNTGAAGIILFRTIMLIMTLFMVFWTLNRKSVSFPLSFIFIYILFFISLKNTGERPVLFTIFFTVLTFFLLENFRDRKSKKIFLLVPLMILWSNLHGGFVIGIIVILVFMFGEGIGIFLKKVHYTKIDVYLFYGTTALAIGASGINPLGWDALIIAANIPFKYQAIHENIQEYFSPYKLYKDKMYPVSYGYVFLLAISVIIFISRFRKTGFTHVLLLTAFLIMSLFAKRLVIYYALIGSLILAVETDVLLRNLLHAKTSEAGYKKTIMMLTLAATISATFYLVGNIFLFKRITFGRVSSNSIPVKAVDFIENNKLSGNMFNDYGYGGYITWRLYPNYKTFIDTRGLNIAVRTEYGWIMNAEEIEVSDNRNSTTKKSLPEMLLAHYDINYVFLTVINPFYQTHAIIYKLAESDEWVLVYSDNTNVIFIKNDVRNKQIIETYGQPADDLYDTVIYQSARNALRNKSNPRSLISLGDTLHKMNRLEDAHKAYRYALERIPDSPVIKGKIKQIETDMQQKQEHNR